MFKLFRRRLFSCPREGAATSTSKAPLAFGLVVSAAVIAAPVSVGATNVQLSNLIVQTSQGAVQGFAKNGLTEFLGIPYAAPPIGNLRWRPPVSHSPWKNVLKATAFGPTCAQIYELGVFAGPPNNNEDCLYLNVFTPNVDAKGRSPKLPVVFWSYGGGDVDGESNDYDGSKLALVGHTVVVTFNYRLNLFGTLAHPALDHEGHLFANYGILDNQFALEWVKQNIANFGGDPNNITISGQSAGAWNVASQILSPLSKGLFSKAICQSGGGCIPGLTPLSIAEQKGTDFAVAAGCGSGTDASVAQCLRNLPAAKIEALAGNGNTYGNQGETGIAPYVVYEVADGQILPTVAIDAYQTGKFNHVPMILGGTQNEGEFFIAPTEYYESPRAPLTAAQFQAAITNTYSGNAGPGNVGSPPAYPAGTVAAVLAHYQVSNYPSAQLAWGAESGDSSQLCRDRHIAQILANQVPLYTYEFRDQTAPDYFPAMPGFTSLAYHTSDIAYYFPLYHGGPSGIAHPLNAKQENLSDQLVAAWTNFAWTGNPNGEGNKTWPRYTGPKGSFFTENISPAGLSTETDTQFAAEHNCGFWDGILVYQSTVQ